MKTYDAIIVGARVAGATTAMLLARRGYRVLLVDRARFPSEIPHGHMIHKDGPRRLREWGLLDRIINAGTPPVDTVTTHFGDFPLVARNVGLDGLAWGYAPRRRLLDELLIEAAVVAGAEFREGISVDGLTFEGGLVTGITGGLDRCYNSFPSSISLLGCALFQRNDLMATECRCSGGVEATIATMEEG